MPYLKCVDEEEAKYSLEEIHEGVRGDHAGPRSLVSKVIRTGYFCLTMQVDAVKVVKIGILCRIIEGRWDRRLEDWIVNRKILHIFRFKVKNTLIMILYVE